MDDSFSAICPSFEYFGHSDDREVSCAGVCCVMSPGHLSPVPLVVSGSQHRFWPGRGASCDSRTPSRASQRSPPLWDRKNGPLDGYYSRSPSLPRKHESRKERVVHPRSNNRLPMCARP